MEAPQPYIASCDTIVNFQEFYDIGEYYLQLTYYGNEEISIVCYNTDKLDGIRYQKNLDIQQFYNINNIFRQYTNINDIYELIIDLIKDKKCSFSMSSENVLYFSFTITDIKRNNRKVEITLTNHNSNTKEYIKILSNEIRTIRNNYNQEIKEIKDEIKLIKNMILKNNNSTNTPIESNESSNNNHKNKNLEKQCFFCGKKNDLKKCICNKYFCWKCMLDNKNNNCKKECFLFNNNLNTLSSFYQISKFPLPKNFEAKIHFTKINKIRVGITFDPNIINETNYNIDSPKYNIYYKNQNSNWFYTYEKGWIEDYFSNDECLRDGDDMVIKLKKGNLSYYLNGKTIGKSYPLDIAEINNKEIYLLIHRRDIESNCQLKYIYELFD
jgi:hypothetical protein